MQIRLPSEMLHLLRQIASKHSINVANFITPENTLALTPDDREMLIDMISDEFASTGLRHNDEPNARGLQLEQLLDRMNNVRAD
jgi:hypothetical protein